MNSTSANLHFPLQFTTKSYRYFVQNDDRVRHKLSDTTTFFLLFGSGKQNFLLKSQIKLFIPINVCSNDLVKTI